MTSPFGSKILSLSEPGTFLGSSVKQGTRQAMRLSVKVAPFLYNARVLLAIG